MANKTKKPVIPVKKKKATAPKVQPPAEMQDITDPLMPELEELVKKNPNRLIGCGG